MIMAGKPQRKTIAVDFDGVIHSYVSGWQGESTIPDPPVEGAIEWLHRAVQVFEVEIFSARARTHRGKFAIRRWLKDQAGNLYYDSPGSVGIEEVRVTAIKGAASVYLDDRGMNFSGTFPSLEAIAEFEPWGKRVAADAGK